MKDNTLILAIAEIGCLILGCMGLAVGEQRLAYAAFGAFTGILGGHLNGRQGG